MTEASKEESQSRFEGETRGVSEGREGKAGLMAANRTEPTMPSLIDTWRLLGCIAAVRGRSKDLDRHSHDALSVRHFKVMFKYSQGELDSFNRCMTNQVPKLWCRGT
jgi:hypothetical protein